MKTSIYSQTLIFAGAVIATTGGAVSAQVAPVMSQIPFVGCASDGQLGPRNPPKSRPVKLPIDAAAAARLAYYQAEESIGVLAPRGWHCLCAYGSSGSSLYVGPDPIEFKRLLSSNWKTFSGSGIEVSLSYGGTSGRFAVAEAISRVFPDRMDFVRDVVSEGFAATQDLPRGPYPTDKLQRKDKNLVEFETPPNTKGLGTDSGFIPNENPIVGILMLVGEDPDLVHASARLPKEDRDLTHVILKQTERDASRPLP